MNPVGTSIDRDMAVTEHMRAVFGNEVADSLEEVLMQHAPAAPTEGAGEAALSAALAGILRDAYHDDIPEDVHLAIVRRVAVIKREADALRAERDALRDTVAGMRAETERLIEHASEVAARAVVEKLGPRLQAAEDTVARIEDEVDLLDFRTGKGKPGPLDPLVRDSVRRLRAALVPPSPGEPQ